jgi:hypothetical protein
VLHFVGRRPGITVGELLGHPRHHQAVARPRADAAGGGRLRHAGPGRTDRRQRLLSLAERGAALERRLYERQREAIIRAYREAGPEAVEGFRRVMRGLMGPEARAALDRVERGAA